MFKVEDTCFSKTIQMHTLYSGYSSIAKSLRFHLVFYPQLDNTSQQRATIAETDWHLSVCTSRSLSSDVCFDRYNFPQAQLWPISKSLYISTICVKSELVEQITEIWLTPTT